MIFFIQTTQQLKYLKLLDSYQLTSDCTSVKDLCMTDIKLVLFIQKSFSPKIPFLSVFIALQNLPKLTFDFITRTHPCTHATLIYTPLYLPLQRHAISIHTHTHTHTHIAM